MKQNQFIKTLRFLTLIAVIVCFRAAAQAQEAYAVYTNDGTLTFYYDNSKNSRSGTKYALNTGNNDPGWYTYHAKDIKKAVFTSSFSSARPTSTFRWFEGAYPDKSNLSEIVGIQYLNTSNVTNMEDMFSHCSSLTSLDVTHFNTENVTSMRSMFYDCSTLTSLDVLHFNTENVTNMGGMFSNCSSLTSLDVTHFNTENVTNMGGMFSNCSSLTSLDVSNFNTSKVTNMYKMFSDCEALTNLDLSNFNTENVTDMMCMFNNCSSLTNLDVSNFNTENVTNMAEMFCDCSSMTNLDISHFDTSKVTSMSAMFSSCSSLTTLDLSNLKTENVTNMGCTFLGCSSMTNLDVSHFNTSKVTNMNGMFAGCSSLTSLNLSNFNTERVTNMRAMFSGCSSLTNLVVSHFNTSKVTNMYGMFQFCKALTNLDVSNFNTANVTDIDWMFGDCSSLTSLNLSNFNTEKVGDMHGMFCGCSSLTSLDLSHFNTTNVTGINYMFSRCEALTTIYVGDEWNTDNVTASDKMFLNCTNLIGGAGTTYDANHVDKEYAHIDGGPSNPGYLTDKSSSTQVKEAYAVRDGEKVTFYYDNQKSNRSNVREINNHYQDSYSYGYGVTTAVIDASFADYRPTSTAYWFLNCGDLTSITGMEYLNTENVTDMQYMFGTCRKLSSINVSHFNTVNVTNMGYLFFNCSSLTTLDMSNINTENVTNMIGMFSGCSSLTKLDLSNFNTKNVTVMAGMFYSCSALTTIYADKDRWSTTKITNYDDGAGMFLNCTNLVGGKGTRYDANHVNHEYAHIDGGPSNPGYLTEKNAEAEDLCDADDLLRFIENLTGTTTTNDNPAEATLCDEPTIDQDVDIEDDLWLYLYGDDNATPPVMNFYGGAINLKSRNSGWTFKGVGFTSNAGATAPLRAAEGLGGITSVGTLTFDGCTMKEGNYTIQNLSDGRMYLTSGTVVEGYGNLINSGNAYLDGSVKVADLANKKGGRIYVTSTLTEDIKVSISSMAEVEQDVPIILGGNGYTMTVADVSHITLTLPDGYEWKYNETVGGIVVSTTSGIANINTALPVAVDSYDVNGHKVAAGHQGITIQRMSDGTVVKIYSPK